MRLNSNEKQAKKVASRKLENYINQQQSRKKEIFELLYSKRSNNNPKKQTADKEIKFSIKEQNDNNGEIFYQIEISNFLNHI